MDEGSSRVCLDLLSVRRQGRRRDCSASSSNPMMEGPGADSEEKHEPVSDIDIAVVDSLKCLTPNGRLEKRTPASHASYRIHKLTPWSVSRLRGPLLRSFPRKRESRKYGKSGFKSWVPASAG